MASLEFFLASLEDFFASVEINNNLGNAPIQYVFAENRPKYKFLELKCEKWLIAIECEKN